MMSLARAKRCGEQIIATNCMIPIIIRNSATTNPPFTRTPVTAAMDWSFTPEHSIQVSVRITLKRGKVQSEDRLVVRWNDTVARKPSILVFC